MEIQFDPNVLQILQFVIAIILPVLVGLVTTKVTKSSTQAILLLTLSFVTSLLTELAASAQAGQVYDLDSGLLVGLGTFVVGVAMHYGLWRHTPVTELALNSGRTSN